jgi:hypothetical protein
MKTALFHRYGRLLLLLIVLSPYISVAVAHGQSRGGRGAISAQDIQKLAAGPLASSAAGACPDLLAGSTVAAPADLITQ